MRRKIALCMLKFMGNNMGNSNVCNVSLVRGKKNNQTFFYKWIHGGKTLADIMNQGI